MQRLTLPGFDKIATWQSIVKALEKKDIDGVLQINEFTKSARGAIFWLRESTLAPAPQIDALARIIKSPGSRFSKLSVTSEPVTLASDRAAIERQIGVLEAAASVLEPEGSGTLHESLETSKKHLAKYERLIGKAKGRANFTERCKDIKTCGGVGGLELSDREYYQQREARALLDEMVKAGFPHPLAIELIATESDIRLPLKHRPT